MKIIEGEKWRLIKFHTSANGGQYAISNFGRLSHFIKKPIDGVILKGSIQDGYPIWRFKIKKEKGGYLNCAFLLHRLVADNFLPKATKGKNIVIHLNHKKNDNHFSNLAWANIKQSSDHAQHSPRVKKAKLLAKQNGNRGNTKLNIQNIREIKKLLTQGKTLKFLALKYQVSDMQIYRIKIGENWSSVK